jgi:hypothetical protein
MTLFISRRHAAASRSGLLHPGFFPHNGPFLVVLVPFLPLFPLVFLSSVVRPFCPSLSRGLFVVWCCSVLGRSWLGAEFVRKLWNLLVHAHPLTADRNRADNIREKGVEHERRRQKEINSKNTTFRSNCVRLRGVVAKSFSL